ncbi:MAG: hypothetical protein ACJ73S_18215, partial [Mycobacteriales bacterium]
MGNSSARRREPPDEGWRPRAAGARPPAAHRSGRRHPDGPPEADRWWDESPAPRASRGAAATPRPQPVPREPVPRAAAAP